MSGPLLRLPERTARAAQVHVGPGVALDSTLGLTRIGNDTDGGHPLDRNATSGIVHQFQISGMIAWCKLGPVLTAPLRVIPARATALFAGHHSPVQQRRRR
jgi:hypothetical protein